jgi:hypothetical protein
VRGNETVSAPAPRQNSVVAETEPRPANQWNYTQSGWQQTRPAESPQNDYSVVNGFARPNYQMHVTGQSTPSENQGSSVYVIPGHYSAAQHFSGSGSPYTVYSSGNYSQPRNDRTAGNNTYIMPGHFTASERLNSSESSSGRESQSSGWSRHSDENRGVQSESHSHNESHFESRGSSSESSHNSSSSSSSSHSGGSSGGSSSSGKK